MSENEANQTSVTQAAEEPGKDKQSEPVSAPVKTKTTKGRPRRKRGIMRSFFSHIIVAALAVAGVGGYFHWEDILSQTGGRVCAYEVLGKYGSTEPGAKTAVASTPQSSPAQKAAETTPDVKSSEAVSPKPAAGAEPSLKPSDEQTSEMKVDEKPVAKDQAAATVDDTDKAAVKEAGAKADASIDEAVVKPAERANDAEQPKAAEASNSDEADTPKVAIVSSLDENSFEAELNNARRAYWVDEKAAEKAYLELIAQYPDKADIKGELGNIYVKVGDNEKAASQFLDAGMIWVKSGEKDKASKLVSLLEKLSPEKATNLKDALAEAG